MLSVAGGVPVLVGVLVVLGITVGGVVVVTRLRAKNPSAVTTADLPEVPQPSAAPAEERAETPTAAAAQPEGDDSAPESRPDSVPADGAAASAPEVVEPAKSTQSAVVATDEADRPTSQPELEATPEPEAAPEPETTPELDTTPDAEATPEPETTPEPQPAAAAVESEAQVEVPAGDAPADDLRKIEGIGPKMATALQAAGIRTYQQLADADEASLRAAVRSAGMRAVSSLPRWPERARALLDREQ